MLVTPDKTTSQMTLNISLRQPIDTQPSPFFYIVFTNSLQLFCLIYRHKHFDANRCIAHTHTSTCSVALLTTLLFKFCILIFAGLPFCTLILLIIIPSSSIRTPPPPPPPPTLRAHQKKSIITYLLLQF
jgi:hypothetical protein